jgi:hypothetical protein
MLAWTQRTWRMLPMERVLRPTDQMLRRGKPHDVHNLRGTPRGSWVWVVQQQRLEPVFARECARTYIGQSVREMALSWRGIAVRHRDPEHSNAVCYARVR